MKKYCHNSKVYNFAMLWHCNFKLKVPYKIFKTSLCQIFRGLLTPNRCMRVRKKTDYEQKGIHEQKVIYEQKYKNQLAYTFAYLERDEKC